MRIQTTLMTASFTWLVPFLVTYAQAGQSSEDAARDLFTRAVSCHNTSDYQCAISFYLESLRNFPKPQVTARLAWVCHEQYLSMESLASEAHSSLLCAKQYYVQTIQSCENGTTTWDTKVDDCERTQRQWRILQRALDTRAQASKATTPSYAVIPLPVSTHHYVPNSPSPERRGGIDSPARTNPIDHARNLRIAGIVLGSVGLAGVAVGAGFSQLAQQDLRPYVDGPYVWNSYDFLTMGAGGVALLGGALWLSGKIMSPRVIVSGRYFYYR